MHDCPVYQPHTIWTERLKLQIVLKAQNVRRQINLLGLENTASIPFRGADQRTHCESYERVVNNGQFIN